MVFEAIHEAIERRVAIKVLHPQYASDAEFTVRFFNEARAVNLVNHPGLVQISDYGQQSDGTAYIVMEFLPGESLARRMEQAGGKLPSAEAAHLGWKIADSLAAAHDKGVIHRDLKPDNVMLVPDPQMPTGERVKLLDFGIAKLTERSGIPQVRTKTDQVMGTPIYMSPEQCEGAGNVDAKSDVYSLGVMLFELLSGRPPFVAEGGGRILGMHMFVAPPLLRNIAADVPAPLADLVQQLLSKSKAKRPTMRQAAAALEKLFLNGSLPKPYSSSFAPRFWRGEDTAEPLSDEATRLKASPASTLGLSTAQTVKRRPRAQPLVLSLGSGLLSFGGAIIMWSILAPNRGHGLMQRVAPMAYSPLSAPVIQTAAPRPELRQLRPGRFWMGSPKSEASRDDADEKQHEVVVSLTFAIAVTEVTQGQYEQVMGNNPSQFSGAPDRPVENVSWFDAVSYCNRLSEREGIPPCYRIDGKDVAWPDGLRCRGYRLPTEAEWEYAARADGSTKYAGSETLDVVAWRAGTAGGTTQTVAGKRANAWGLYDFSGNVWEWVWDYYERHYETLPPADPIGPDNGTDRVRRGGSWDDEAQYARSASRVSGSPGFRSPRQGFRVARSCP